MRWLKVLASVAATATLALILDRPLVVADARIPPLARLLNPFAGIWRVPPAARELPHIVDLAGLRRPVAIAWDDRRVAHLFAADAHDLYLAQGWVTARDRLWQMEFQTHIAAGRLAEIVGRPALDLDRRHRYLGVPYAAERALAMTMSDPVSREALTAYADGVNAWIASLDARSLPLEYKILDYRPEPWSPLKSILLLKYLALELSMNWDDPDLSRALAALGRDTADRLYPNLPPFSDPVIPPGTPWRFEPLAAIAPSAGFPVLEPWPTADDDREDGARGSNSWAVAGSRTRGGHPILSSDPHLPLQLPSLWYEVGLAAPDHAVHGVSLPGSPAVIIGFNHDIAWGPTNGQTDLIDWYRITFRDDSASEYLYDGAWRDVTWREETIRIRGEQPVVERVPYTHHGPVVGVPNGAPIAPRLPPGLAARWVAHDPSNETRMFLALNRARDYDDFVEALSRFDSPVQNWVYADRHGDIAVWHAGSVPLRWPDQGKYVGDGSNPAFDWQGAIPREHLPHVRNPDRGFVSSANQIPADAGYPYYLGWQFAPFERGARINELLASMHAVVPEDFIAMQNDTVSLHARTLLPALLDAVERWDGDDLGGGELSHDATVAILETLRDWDYRYEPDRVEPVVFDQWQRELRRQIWADDLTTPGGDRLRLPRRDVTAELVLREPESRWIDLRDTEERETLSDIAVSALRRGLDRMATLYGPPGPRWRWGEVRRTHLRHLSRLPGLGRGNLRTGGQYGHIRATTRFEGQSWRMVVELGPDVRAWGGYPGGQSGDPASRWYDDRVDDWLEGRLRPIAFLDSPDALPEAVVHRSMLRPAR